MFITTFFYWASLVVCYASAYAVPPVVDVQSLLKTPSQEQQDVLKRQRVIEGDNNAVYCHKQRLDQLFWLHRLDVVNHPFVVYMKGWTPSVDSLNQTSLTVTLDRPGLKEPLSHTDRLPDFPRIAVRQYREYTKTLSGGVAEIITYGLPPSFQLDSANQNNYTMTLHATTPDGQTLFCYESEISLRK